MGAGSGVDVQALARNLVDATRAPQESLINKKISQSEARISGYGALSFMIGNLRDKFAALDKVSDYDTLSAVSSQSSSVQANITGDAAPGNHQVKIVSLLQGQRSVSKAGFERPDSILTNQNITLKLNDDPETELTLGAGTELSDAVTAINNKWNDKGFQVRMVNTGAATGGAYQLLFSGPAGKSNAFTLSALNDSNSPVTVPGFELNTIQEAEDATFYVDGIKYNRTSNTVTDVLPGVQLELTAPTTGELGATLQLTRDITPIKTKINELVSAYNDLNTVLTDVSNPTSTVAEYGGTLAGDSTVESLRRQVRNLFLPSTTEIKPELRSLRDLGISLDKTGKMTLDDKRLTKVLTTRFDEAVSLMTDNQLADTDTLTMKVSVPGQARNGVMALANLLRSYAPLSSQTNNAKAQIEQHKADLDRLDLRMTQLLERYNRQFVAMENLLNQTNSLKSSLKSSFDGMAAAYSNK